MGKIKKGSKVVRISHNRDIIFVVDRIIKDKGCKKIAVLKGITERIEVDSFLYDLELVSWNEVKNYLRGFDFNIESKIKEQKELFYLNNRKRKYIESVNGKILHLDGDKRYSEKSLRYYKSFGVKAIVKNVQESRQPKIVYSLLKIYNPDILVITRP